MSNLVYVVAVVALVAIQCGFVTNALIEGRNNDLEKSLRAEAKAKAPSKGRVLRKFVRILEPPPPIVKHAPGAPLDLFCEAMGSPTPALYWLRNGQPVYDVEQKETGYLVPPNPVSVASVVSVLRITNPSPNRKDVYTCVARSEARVDKASSIVYSYDDEGAYLQEVLTPPAKPRVVGYYSTLLQRIGSEVALPCHTVGGNGVWSREDDELYEDERVQILPSGELYFSELRWSDMGDYTCTVKNLYGSDSGSTFLYPTKG